MARTARLVFTGTVASALCATMAGSQPAPDAGNVQTIRFTSDLTATDNFSLVEDSPGDAFLFTNSLDVSQVFSTSIDRFAATAGGDLRFADLPEIGQETSLDNGRITANFLRELDDNSIAASLFFNDADIEFLDPLRTLDDDGDFDDTLGEGRRRLLVGSFGVSINEDGPVRFILNGNVRDTEFYDGVTDPDLVDSINVRGDARIGVDVTDVTSVFIRGEVERFEEEDDLTLRDEYDVRAGLATRVNPTTTLTFDLGFSEVDVERADGDDDNDTSTVGSVGLLADRPNGTVGLLFNSRLTENGTRNEIEFSRAVDLPAGEFALTLGASTRDDEDLSALVALDYSIERSDRRFGIGFNQNVDPDEDGNDRVLSSLDANFFYVINPVSSIGLTALASRQTFLESDSEENDVTRVTLELNYTHELAQFWSLTGGFRHRLRAEDNEEDARENAVFLNLTREVSFRR